MLDVLTQKHLDLLKLFDHNRDFGPCIGKHVCHVCLVQCYLQENVNIAVILSTYPPWSEKITDISVNGMNITDC